MQNDISVTQKQIDDYELSMMRRGPYYEAKTNTLRIPHRFACPPAATQWKKRGMSFDAQRHEYFIRIKNPAQHALGVTQRCREYFYQFYKAYYPHVTPIEVPATPEHVRACLSMAQLEANEIKQELAQSALAQTNRTFIFTWYSKSDCTNTTHVDAPDEPTARAEFERTHQDQIDKIIGVTAK